MYLILNQKMKFSWNNEYSCAATLQISRAFVLETEWRRHDKISYSCR